ncbi:MAG: hypothetical protein AAF236_03615, partial [Verrucomicrobiota bacterium]
MFGHRHRSPFIGLFGIFLAFIVGRGLAETDEVQFSEQSLQYRTALHYDPLLDGPLGPLIKLYGEGERLDELIGLYRAHFEQYPDDAGAKTVLIRILRKEDNAAADKLLAEAIQLHPGYAPLRYLFFQSLESKGDARALEQLAEAIRLEKAAARRAEWLSRFLSLAVDDESRELASELLRARLDREEIPSSELFALGLMMQRHQFWELSKEALGRVVLDDLSPEERVDLQVRLAVADGELGNRSEAAERLDTLLGQLAADHWRRREILSLRLSVIATEEERGKLLAQVGALWEADRDNVDRAIDYVEVLLASEKQNEALEFLLAESTRLPDSERLEARALAMLAAINDLAAEEAWLDSRLEQNPERSDLRFRLVMARFALGKDGDARQDFETVLVGLPSEEVSERLLELQRFLRRIDRLDAASEYLERYVQKDRGDLAAATELLQIHLLQDDRAAAEQVILQIDVTGGTADEIGDLAGLLINEEFVADAKRFLDAYLKTDPRHFELRLDLIDASALLGDRAVVELQIEAARSLVDSASRYRSWLLVASEAEASFDNLAAFFEAEQRRFDFSNREWGEEEIEKFLLFCEIGRQKNLIDRVATAIRRRLESSDLDEESEITLRRLLVSSLDSDPQSSEEVEEQLAVLLELDPDNASLYTLKQAIAYHQIGRIDLAQDLLDDQIFTEIKDPDLLWEAPSILLGYGYHQKAADGLRALTSVAPGEILAWERRLALLTALGNESELRDSIRYLTGSDNGFRWDRASLKSLREQLVSSYWRSASELLSDRGGSRADEALPLLNSIQRESSLLNEAPWVDWVRAYLLYRLGRSEEADSALARFRENQGERISFPDGIELFSGEAESVLTPSP